MPEEKKPALQRARDSAGAWLVPAGALLAVWPDASPARGLTFGLAVALLVGNPYLARTRKLTHPLLTVAVVGLGAGMNLGTVAATGAHGFLYTVAGISFCLGLGTLLARSLQVERDAGLLITAGTAICGGSAIAALVPVLRAKEHEVSVALGTVFMLNAVALILFPLLGHRFALTETQFGLWAALAIHDTSSVVGAAQQYGDRALEIATTVKLARALWIVPLTLAVAAHRRGRTEGAAKGARRPWFILGFVLAAALTTYVPALHAPGLFVAGCARHLMVVTLFVIGVNLTPQALRSVGARPLFLGVGLWLCVGAASLGAILAGWVA